jgi:gamma-glutamylcyclotransferase (GGCT)/AIG2-like uncharacterized protein YtfP
MHTIFVYGTLLSGEPNHRVLRGADRLRDARTAPQYSLHDLGAFPGLVCGGVTTVVGELYSVDATTLAELDRFEGTPRLYRRVAVQIADGATAHAYVMRAEQVASRPRIASGDWRAFRREKGQ